VRELLRVVGVEKSVLIGSFDSHKIKARRFTLAGYFTIRYFLAPWWCVRRTLFSEVSNKGRK
jgi:hypothetical protein